MALGFTGGRPVRAGCGCCNRHCVPEGVEIDDDLSMDCLRISAVYPAHLLLCLDLTRMGDRESGPSIT